MSSTPAVRHGYYARSPSALEIRGRKVARLMRRLRVAAPWLEPSDESTARAYCELEIISAGIFAALTKLGLLNGKGEARQLVDQHRRIKLAQLAYARELGLSPSARMAIKASGTRAAFDLPGAMANAEDAAETTIEASDDE